MEQSFMLFVFYKGVAPVEPDIFIQVLPGVYIRRQVTNFSY
jgi:hypothetical protein